jgi:2-dehydro-3-deoxyphosphogluconate aldolase/(4S)-4-hydroxy-2-oxoglutarate aldolase
MSAVFPGTRFMPTGGVTPANVGEYLALPSVAACGGTWICAEPAGIEERAREAAAA